MERLSEKLKSVIDECINAWSQIEEDACKAAIQRLAAYEDTGLEPEEIARFNETLRELMRNGDDIPILTLVNLANAQNEGRLVVLPCKVGDTVYITTYDRKIEERIISEIRVLEYAIFIQCYGFGYPINYLSKTVFLTREEAEKALKEDA